MPKIYIDRNGNFHFAPGAERCTIPAWFGIINDEATGDYTLTLDTTPNAGAEFASVYTTRWIGGISELLRFRLARLLFAARDQRIADAVRRAVAHDQLQQPIIVTGMWMSASNSARQPLIDYRLSERNDAKSDEG